MDFDGNTIYDKFVSPPEYVTDFRTKWSGIRSKDLRADRAISLQQVWLSKGDGCLSVMMKVIHSIHALVVPGRSSEVITRQNISGPCTQERSECAFVKS